MTFADDLREARIHAGLTETELANRLGVTLRSVGSWENGQKLSPANRAKVAQFIESVTSQGAIERKPAATLDFRRDTDFGESPGFGLPSRMRATRRWVDSDGGEHVLEITYTHPDPGESTAMNIRAAYFMSALHAAQHELEASKNPQGILSMIEREQKLSGPGDIIDEGGVPASAAADVVELPVRGAELPEGWETLAARRPGPSAVDAQREAQDKDAEQGD